MKQITLQDRAGIYARKVPVLLTCGTRIAVELQEGNYRVLCATCQRGGSVHYPTAESATSAAVRDSNKTCRVCGAS